MTFDLDYAYAEKTLEALNQATATQVVIGFKRALERKLGKLSTPAPEFDASDPNVPAQKRFERFFDELFTVAPADINMPLSLEEFKQRAQEARGELLKQADSAKNDPEYADLEDMYRCDALNYEGMIAYLDAGNVGAAIRTYWNQDTAARDWLFMGPDEVRNRRTNLLLEGYDRDGRPVTE